jgi:hypothetical protein
LTARESAPNTVTRRDTGHRAARRSLSPVANEAIAATSRPSPPNGGTGERESRARPRLVDRPGPATRASRRPDQAGEPSGSTESHGSVRTSPEAAVLEQPRPFGLGRYHRHVEAPHRVRRAARSMAGTAATWASVDCERGSTFLESKCFSTCRGRAFGHHGRTPRAMACMARSRGAWPLPAAPHQLAEACDRAGCVARMGRRKSCIRQGANSAH